MPYNLLWLFWTFNLKFINNLYNYYVGSEHLNFYTNYSWYTCTNSNNSNHRISCKDSCANTLRNRSYCTNHRSRFLVLWQNEISLDTPFLKYLPFLDLQFILQFKHIVSGIWNNESWICFATNVPRTSWCPTVDKWIDSKKVIGDFDLISNWACIISFPVYFYWAYVNLGSVNIWPTMFGTCMWQV